MKGWTFCNEHNPEISGSYEVVIQFSLDNHWQVDMDFFDGSWQKDDQWGHRKVIAWKDPPSLPDRSQFYIKYLVPQLKFYRFSSGCPTKFGKYLLFSDQTGCLELTKEHVLPHPNDFPEFTHWSYLVTTQVEESEKGVL